MSDLGPMIKPDESGLSLLIPIISIIGIVGNVTVLTVYLQKMRQPSVVVGRSTANIFIATLAMNDLIACIVVMPLTLIFELAPRLIFTTDISCQLYFLFVASVIPFSSFLMTAISIDRYCCICHPLKPILNPLRARIIVVTLAATAVAMGTLVAVQWRAALSTDLEETAPNDTSSTTTALLVTSTIKPYPTGGCASQPALGSFMMEYYHYIHNTITFVVALAVTFIFYALIYSKILTRHLQKLNRKAATSRALKLSTTADSSKRESEPLKNNQQDDIIDETSKNASADMPPKSPVNGHTGKNESTKERKPPKKQSSTVASFSELGQQIRLAAMLFVVTVVFTLSYVPAFLANYTGLFGQPESEHWNRFVFYIYFVNNAANPIIYGVMNRNFREDLRYLCCGQRPAHGSSAANSRVR